MIMVSFRIERTGQVEVRLKVEGIARRFSAVVSAQTGEGVSLPLPSKIPKSATSCLVAGFFCRLFFGPSMTKEVITVVTGIVETRDCSVFPWGMNVIRESQRRLTQKHGRDGRGRIALAGKKRGLEEWGNKDATDCHGFFVADRQQQCTRTSVRWEELVHLTNLCLAVTCSAQ